MGMWMTYVWTFVFVIFLINATARQIPKSVSTPISFKVEGNVDDLVYIPKNTSLEDSWIPIPYSVMQHMNITNKKEFKFVRLKNCTNNRTNNISKHGCPPCQRNKLLIALIILTAIILTIPIVHIFYHLLIMKVFMQT